MIRTALKFIQNELDAYIAANENDITNYPLGSIVALKSVASADGKVSLDDAVHITMMMTGVEEERIEGKHPYYVPVENNQVARLNPPVTVDLNILFVANSQHYETALRDLSGVICFFQSYPVFDAAKYPALNVEASNPDKEPWQVVDKIAFRIMNLTLEQQNNLWSMLGPKYMPSIVYRMKMLTVFDTKAQQKAPVITELNLAD